MKITKGYYEVWVGDDLVDDCLDYNAAIELVKDQLSHKEDGIDIVLDEVTHYTIDSYDDIAKLGE